MQTHPTLYPTDLTDEEWNHIKSLVPKPKSGKGKRGRPAEHDRRSLVNAIFYIVKAGCAWRLLPRDYPRWQTVYGYYRAWSQDWTWTFIHDTLRDWLRKSSGRKVAPTAAIIDRSSTNPEEIPRTPAIKKPPGPEARKRRRKKSLRAGRAKKITRKETDFQTAINTTFIPPLTPRNDTVYNYILDR